MILIFLLSIERGTKNWNAFGTCARGISPEAKFLDVIGTKVFCPPPPPPQSKSGSKIVCNVNIVYGNLKSENSQIMPRNLNEIVNCKFMNSASELARAQRCLLSRCQWWNKKARLLWVYHKPSMNCNTTKEAVANYKYLFLVWGGGGAKFAENLPNSPFNKDLTNETPFSHIISTRCRTSKICISKA